MPELSNYALMLYYFSRSKNVYIIHSLHVRNTWLILVYSDGIYASHVFWTFFFLLNDGNPLASGSCNVHCSFVLWMRLHIDGSTCAQPPMIQLVDLVTSPDFRFPWFLKDFSSAINIDAVITFISIMISTVLLTILTAIRSEKQYFRKSWNKWHR